MSALNAEMETENAIVSANWRNRIPVVPGKNATGTNTATSTSEVATTAPATSLMAMDAALCGSEIPSVMWRWTFSMTTMASSTTRPVARVRPNKVSVLIEKPRIFTNAKVPISETGMVMAGIKVLRQSCRKMKITSTTRHDGLQQGVQNVFDRFADDAGGVKRDGIFDSGREVLGKPHEFGFRSFVHGERVGAGQLGDAEADGVVAIEAQIAAVIFRAQFGAAHVAQADQGAVRARFQNNIFKFRGLDQAAHGAHADLVTLAGERRRLANLAGG